jgi:hypothetical protein
VLPLFFYFLKKQKKEIAKLEKELAKLKREQQD